MKRLLVLLLAVLMLFTAVACQTDSGDGAGTGEQQTTKPQGTQGTDPNEESSTNDPTITPPPPENTGNRPATVVTGPVDGDDEFELDLSQFDYKNGENPTVFSMLVRANRNGAPEEFIVDMEAEGERTVLELAVYQRNSDIEEALGIVFDFPLEQESAIVTTFTNDIGAGLHTYDIANIGESQLTSVMGQDLVYNWNDVNYLGLDKVWWFSRSGLAPSLSINGVLNGITGDASNLALGKVLLMYFNIDLLPDHTDYNADQLYDLVWEGQGSTGGWTMDLLLELTAGAYEDANGNQEADAGDFYGANVYYGTICQNFLPAFNIPIAMIDEDGNYYTDLDTDRMATALQKLHDFYWEENRNLNTSDRTNSTKFFGSGKSLFTAGGLEWITNFISLNVEYKYGILPYPKLDEAQTNYQAIFSNVETMFIAPANITQEAADRMGVIMETLAYESYNSTTIAYYETYLKGRGTSDEDSYDMIDMIFHETLIFDPGYTYSALLSEGANQSLVGMVAGMVGTSRGHLKFAEIWEANKDVYQANFDSLFNSSEEE